MGGCTEFVHGPGWPAFLWEKAMLLFVGGFLLTAVQSLVQDELLQQQQAARAAAKTKTHAGQSPDAGSRGRSRSRGRSTDAAFKPSVADQEAAAAEVAPAVGRLVSSRTRSASRPSRKRK